MLNWKNVIVLIFFILLTTIASQSSYFSTEKVQVGDVSDKAIYSPKTQRYEDEEATKKMQEDALTNVQSVYNEDASIYSNIETDMSLFIDSIVTFKEKKSNLDASLSEMEEQKNFNYKKEIESYRSEIKNPFSFSNDEIDYFVALDKNDLTNVEKTITHSLKTIFDERVTHENSSDVIAKFKKSQILLNYFTTEQSNRLIERISLRIEPNFKLDEKATTEKQNEALNSVDVVFKEIKKGEIIVRIGEIVTEEQYDKLVELGMVSDGFGFLNMLKKMPYFAIIFFIIFAYISYFYKNEFSSFKQYLFLISTLSFTVILTNAITDTYINAIPLITALMIYAVFWGRRFTMFAAIAIGLMVSNGEFILLSISLLTGIVLTIAFHNIDKRINILAAGLSLGFILALSELIISYAFDLSIEFTAHFSLLVSGTLAAVFTVGLIPVVENVLGTVTALKLYELSDPNHPLLKRLLTEALGTYTHSLMVANLAELAAEKVGANGMMLRVAAYFHDVGKLKNPEYFIENSTPENNPHQFIDEATSADIIRRHPIDSVKICREYKIPEAILSMIECHHGDATLYHLYNPAKEKNPNVSIDDFRYQTSKPKTKEDAILLLADSTEAFSRVLKNDSAESVDKKIRKMINDKVEHGILSESNLTLKDLNEITEAFISLLVNSNHERIPYSK